MIASKHEPAWVAGRKGGCMASVATGAKTATVQVNIHDGTREILSTNPNILITVIDGFKKQIFREYYPSGRQAFKVPFYDNLGDQYTVIAWAGGYDQAGFFPVKVSDRVLGAVDLMLLPKHPEFSFRNARWDMLRGTHPDWVNLFRGGATGAAAAKDRFSQFMESNPEALAALLNILTAMEQIHLPSGTPLDYFRELIWDETMQRDRFFGYASRELLSQVRRAEMQGLFKQEAGSAVFHPGATESYKQVQFGEANVQLTFHDNEGDCKTIGGVDCLKVETDIDYYRDLLSHALLEVTVNGVTGGLTDPKQVYVLRWMAGRRAGVPDFNPPYTIVAG